MSKNQRLSHLDGLRACSISFVLAAHMLPIGPHDWRFNEAIGALGMAIFFSLSGFLITENLLRGQHVGHFFVRRLARILPLAYLFLIIVFLIFSFDLYRLIGSMLFLENYEFTLLNEFNGHFWSLCVEIHFYFAIGLAVFLFGKRGVFVVVPLCVLVTVERILTGATVSIETHLRVDEILAGSIVAIFYHYRSSQAKMQPFWLIIALAFCAASSWPYSGALQYARPYFGGAVLYAGLALKPSWLGRLLSHSLARYIANISYALYVIHPISTHGWFNEGSHFSRYLIKRPLSFAVTFLLAHMSTFHYEATWIRLAKKVTRQPSSS